MDDNAGNLIRTLRQKLSMTQEEFAHEIAVTVSTVNRWENAHAEPPGTRPARPLRHR